MEFSVVITHLQNQFSGQMVLYVDDLAKVLGKSDKAISNLIARDALPFKVKFVGGLRCTDIFEVAQWLSSDQGMAVDSAAVVVKPPPSKVSIRPANPAKPAKLTIGQAQLTSDEAPALTGKVAAMLLKMRHGQAVSLGRFVHSLRNVDEVVFMNEVMEKLFYTADLLAASYVVTIKKLAPKGAKVLAEETRKYFGTEGHAGDFLMAKLSSWRNRKAGPTARLIEHFTLDESGRTLFHAIACDHKLTVEINSIGMEFPGQ
jgi:hypothetical protein